MRRRKTIIVLGAVAVLVAGFTLTAHRIFRIPRGRLADGLAIEQLSMWRSPDRLAQSMARMRETNAEWDFMSRTYLVLAFANLALREPARSQNYLEAIDRILDATLTVESSEGQLFFMMPYAKAKPFLVEPQKSLFVDGEIALMLGARRMVAEDARYAELGRERVEVILARMKKGPILSGESYPNEAWTFCNSTAIAAVRIADALDGTDHSEFIAQWLAASRAKLVEPETGLLISSYQLDGTHLDGPEGSSIWMVAHNLLLIDPELARDQYRRAKKELGRTIFGFGYAREWPPNHVGPQDVDSGAVVPVLEASPSSSGLMILAAAAFDDREMVDALLSSLGLAAGAERTMAGGMRFTASNGVGDAVILYALVQGPLWAKVRK